MTRLEYLLFLLSKMASVSWSFLWGLAFTTWRNRKPMRVTPSAMVLGAGNCSALSPCSRSAFPAAWAVSRVEVKLVRNVGACGPGARVWWRGRPGELTQRCSHLRMPLCPAFAAPEGCLSPQTKAPSASLRQTPGHGLASPTKKGVGQPGVAPAMFQRQLGRKGSSFRSAQLGCRQTESGALRCTEQRLEGKRRVVHAHDRTSRTETGYTDLKAHPSTLTLAQ